MTVMIIADNQSVSVFGRGIGCYLLRVGDEVSQEGG